MRFSCYRTGFHRFGLALGLAFAVVNAKVEEARLLRFPAIHGDRVVFAYAGDLYVVPAKGGVARRLTSHSGYEMFPRFSPDGRSIAFTGQYDGNTEVYLMSADGGVPRRLTYTAGLSRDDLSDRMGPNNIVMTWRDAGHIVFRSRRTQFNDFKGQLCLATPAGDLPETLPLPRGGWCSYSPDGKRLAYNRIFREFRTWKRYRGGQADDVWIYDFETKSTTNLTRNAAQDVFPMWHGKRIYFLSDRDENKRMNLYAIEVANGETKKLTDFTEFDIKFPSLGEDSIVFENGGYLYRLELPNGKARRIPVEIQEDLAIGRGGWRDVSKETTGFDLSPDGNRAVIGARGEVFTVPAKHGATRNLTRTPGVHERDAQWSPDGKWIAYISDATGEDEIEMRSQAGAEAPVVLTAGADTYKYQLRWSPDSQRILWSDKKLRLQFVEVSSREVVLVNQATAWEITDFDWSPDSQWIAYARPEERQFPRIYLFSLATRQTHPVTDSWFSSAEPTFSSDGKYLFFVSSRAFSPRYSQSEWNHAYFDMAGVFLVTLARDVKSPFEPRSDEVKLKADDKPTEAASEGKEKDGGKAKSDTKKDDSKVVVKVDPEGLSQRIASLPIAASSYRRLSSVGDKLFYVRQGSRDEKPKLLVYEFEKQKETDLGDFGAYVVSADHKKMLIKSEDTWAIVDLPAAKVELKERLNLGDLKMELDRRAEWAQIYRESWRQMRDFVYAPNLHAVDWPGIRARYEPLLAHVNHRADLTYILGEMVGELNLGHAYVGGGDYPKAPRIAQGLLGAKYERDRASGFVRIVEILRGQNWDKALRSPLTEMGVDAKVGDFLIAVDGRLVSDLPDFHAALVDKVGKQVRLKLNFEPKVEGSRETTVIPIEDERPLYYYNWVQKNIETVDRATDGRVGYVHVPNMLSEGLNEFVKYYYPQTHKEALIVDVRGNGGGNVSPQIIERLRREPVMFTVARNGSVNVDPTGTVLGPKVLLLDEFSASDGDIVAYRFRKHGLGPIVGKRSWGGVVGIRGSLPLLDGGYLNRPEFSRYDLEGKEWIMEGVGVEPDVVVDNDPAHEFAGVDDQLNQGIELILAELGKRSPKVVSPPPYPDKSK